MHNHAAVLVLFNSPQIQVAAEIAAPLATTRKITMISSGKGDVGASKLTGEVLDVVAKLPEVVEKLTGVNMSKALKVR